MSGMHSGFTSANLSCTVSLYYSLTALKLRVSALRLLSLSLCKAGLHSCFLGPKKTKVEQ